MAHWKHITIISSFAAKQVPTNEMQASKQVATNEGKKIFLTLTQGTAMDIINYLRHVLLLPTRNSINTYSVFATQLIIYARHKEL